MEFIVFYMDFIVFYMDLWCFCFLLVFSWGLTERLSKGLSSRFIGNHKQI